MSHEVFKLNFYALGANEFTQKLKTSINVTKFLILIFTYILLYGARGDVVFTALRYKPAGRGFDSRWYHWNVSVT